jgi:hypothetical protein
MGDQTWSPIKWKIYFEFRGETPKFVLLTKDATNIAEISETIPKIYFPEEVLLILLGNRRMHCHEIYWHLRCNKSFSGILPEHKLKEMAKILGKSLQSVKNKLRQLEALGLVEKRKTCWMVTSQDLVVALTGKKRNRKLDVTGFFGNASRMTTYAYAAIVSRGAIRARVRQRKGNRSKTATAIPLAASLTAKDCGRSEQTIHKQRARAKRLSIIDYDRDIHFFKDANGQTPKFTDGMGGKFFFSKDGTMLHEGPALITDFVKSKCVMIRPSLLDLASERHYLLRQNQ